MNSKITKIIVATIAIATLAACGKSEEKKAEMTYSERATAAAACSIHYGAVATVQEQGGQIAMSQINFKRFEQLHDRWVGDAEYDQATKNIDSNLSAAGDGAKLYENIGILGQGCVALDLPTAEFQKK